MVFEDRTEAGRKLAERLEKYRDGDGCLVLGLPRGGVTVAREIARALELPLDILIVRKVGFPGNPEFAVGALAETGAQILNDDIIAAYGIGHRYLDAEIVHQQKEIERRQRLYRQGRGVSCLHGRKVIVVDDGVATGATFKAAVRAVREAGAAKIIAAVPVASPESAAEIAALVDEWVCLATPMWFMAVGAFYRHFDQVEDAEVVEMLDEARGARPHPDVPPQTRTAEETRRQH